MKNDENSASPYKSPKLLTLLSPMDNVLGIMVKRVTGVLSPSYSPVTPMM